MLQISRTYALLFHEGGVCHFTDLENSDLYGLLTSSGSGRIWALVDSNPDLAKPTGVFATGRLFFVVQAASPRPQRVQWLDAVDSQRFYMKGWSFSEVLQAYVGLSPRAFMTLTFPPAARSLGTLPPTRNASSGNYTTGMEPLSGR